MKQPKGQILAISALFLSVIVLLVAVLVSLILGNNYAIKKRYQQKIAFNVAEAGLDYSLQKLNVTPVNGTETVNLDNGTFVTTVSGSNNLKEIESIGYFPNASNPKTTKTVRAQVEINTDNVAFHYGVQVGEGGLIMANNSEIVGNVYSNGNITGTGIIKGTTKVATGSQSSIVYDNHVNDQKFGDNVPILDVAQSFKADTTGKITKVSLLLKKECETANKCPPNLTVRILKSLGSFPNISPDKANSVADGTLTMDLLSETTFGWIDVTMNNAQTLTAGQYYWVVISLSDPYPTGNNKRYLWWAKSSDNSGYGNGFGIYSQDWDAITPAWTAIDADMSFKVFMASNSTYIDGITIKDAVSIPDSGDAYAYEIKNNVKIDDEAFYTIIDTNSSVNNSATSYNCNPLPVPPGKCHSDQPAPGLANMPISDANITDWKNDALAGGPPTGDVNVTGTQTLGPKKVIGNLTVQNGAKLAISGTVHVTGNITLYQKAEVYLDSGYGPLSGTIINDGTITVENNVIFCGSGYTPATKICNTANKSYIMLLSTNSADTAIDVANNAKAVIFYAANGGIFLKNGAGVFEATGKKLTIEENASVTYESGLADSNFSSGPGASWAIKKGTWQEL